MTANAGMRIVQCTSQECRLQGIESIECAKSVQPTEWPLTIGCHFLQERHSSSVLTPQEHLLRRVALPAIGAVESSDQSCCIETIQARDAARLGTNRIDAIDASLVRTGAQIEALLPICRNPLRVLDDGAIHVGYPEGSIRARLNRCRAKPIIAGRQELAILLIRSAAAGEGDPLNTQVLTVNQIVDRLADEGTAGKRRAKQLIAIDDGTARRGEMIGSMRVVETRQRTANGKYRGRAWRYRHRHTRLRSSKVWIAANVMIGEDIVI